MTREWPRNSTASPLRPGNTGRAKSQVQVAVTFHKNPMSLQINLWTYTRRSTLMKKLQTNSKPGRRPCCRPGHNNGIWP